MLHQKFLFKHTMHIQGQHFAIFVNVQIKVYMSGFPYVPSLDILNGWIRIDVLVPIILVVVLLTTMTIWVKAILVPIILVVVLVYTTILVPIIHIDVLVYTTILVPPM